MSSIETFKEEEELINEINPKIIFYLNNKRNYLTKKDLWDLVC